MLPDRQHQTTRWREIRTSNSTHSQNVQPHVLLSRCTSVQYSHPARVAFSLLGILWHLWIDIEVISIPLWSEADIRRLSHKKNEHKGSRIGRHVQVGWVFNPNWNSSCGYLCASIKNLPNGSNSMDSRGFPYPQTNSKPQSRRGLIALLFWPERKWE